MITMLLVSWLFSLFICVQSSPQTTESLITFNEGSPDKELKMEEDLGERIALILETYMCSCSIMLVQNQGGSWVVNMIIRLLTVIYRSYSLFDMEFTNISSVIPYESRLQLRMRMEETLPCQVFILDLTDGQSLSLAIEFLENIRLFLIPDASVIFLGPRGYRKETLAAEALINTVHVLYLVIGRQRRITKLNATTKDSAYVTIYSRCLYCKNGGNGSVSIYLPKPDKESTEVITPFENQFQDMRGHQFQIIQLEWAPMIALAHDPHYDDSGIVFPVDSVHERALKSISNALNFTYVMREQLDGKWGISTDSGNWTGMIGLLQHHKADFSLAITYSYGRSQVVDLSRIMYREPLVMVMSKPRPPPPYLALIRPFTGELWAAALATILSAGLILWGFQVGWRRVSNRPGLTLDLSLLSTWSIQFEEPATAVPTNDSSLIFIGTWWIYCTIIAAMYKSSLVAHLSIPGKGSAIDTFEELLEADGWTWGYQDTDSNEYDLFKTSSSPTLQRILQGMEIQPPEEQYDRILNSNHVLIIKEFRFKSFKKTIAIVEGGISPFYYSKGHYFANGDSWAFRQNAPFYDAMDKKIQQLIETGHIARWLKDLVGTSTDKLDEVDEIKGSKPVVETDPSGQVVLSLNHLQSAFYLFLIGISLASVAFLGENVISCFGKFSS